MDDEVEVVPPVDDEAEDVVLEVPLDEPPEVSDPALLDSFEPPDSLAADPVDPPLPDPALRESVL